MSGKWKRLQGDCPICNGARRDCRESIESKLVFCHDEQAAPAGYVYLKSDGWGFGIWQRVEDATRQQSSPSYERERQAEALRLKREREYQEKIASQLSPEERDRFARLLLDELTLDPQDLSDLVQRGLTLSQIEADGYRSVESWQRVSAALPPNFPGVNRFGNLAVKQAGYLCPVRDVEGLLVGFQIRRRDPAEGRYGWLSSKDSPVHLNGELPVGVYSPEESTGDAIWLCEGTGAKPSLTRYRYHVPVVGAAGGGFASSPKTTGQTLEALSARYQTKKIVIVPDSGDVQNQHVVSRWIEVYKLLSQLGFEVSFLWWGQISKGEDIDEIPIERSSEFKQISLNGFLAIASEYGGASQEKENKQQAIQQLENLQAELDNARYKELSSLSYPPFLEIDTPNLDFESLTLEPGAIYIVSSAKGTGKTNALIPIVPKFQNVYAWFSRVALGREESSKIGLTWKDGLTSYSGSLKVGFCSNSAHQFNPRNLQQKGLLLVDEADQVFDHNFGDTCNKNGSRPLILSALKAHIDAAVAGGGMGLFMSADITDRDVEYIQALAPAGCPVRLIVNRYQPPRGKLYFDESTTPDALVDRLIQKLEAGEPCFLVDDIKDGVRGCKSITELVLRLHPEWASEIVEINSETSGREDVAFFIENINRESEKVRLISCSPSVVSGISIENGRFNQGVFAFMNGVLTISQASQAIARVRGASEINVWAARRGLIFAANRSADPEEIRSWYQRNYAANCRHLLSFNAQYNPMIEEWDSPHFALFCKNAAYRNGCMLSFRERFKERLIEEGYQVELSLLGTDEAVQAIKAGLQESWHDLELAKARQIAAAEILEDASLNRLLQASDTLTPDQQLDVEKTLLLKRFGQELIEATRFEHRTGESLDGFAAMHLKNHRGQYHRSLEAFYLLVAPDAEAISKDLAIEERQLNQAQSRFAGDIKWNTRRKKAREFLGLTSFFEHDRWFEPKDYKDLVQRARSKAADIKDVLNLSIYKLANGQIFTELMQQVGLSLEAEYVRPGDGSEPYRQRRISDESWQAAQMYVRYRESLKAVREESESAAAIAPSKLAIAATLADHPPDVFSNEAREGGDQETPALVDTLVSAMTVGRDAVLSAWKSWQPDRRAEILSGLQEGIIERLLEFVPDLFLWCSG